MNALQFYVMRTVPVLLNTESELYTSLTEIKHIGPRFCNSSVLTPWHEGRHQRNVTWVWQSS